MTGHAGHTSRWVGWAVAACLWLCLPWTAWGEGPREDAMSGERVRHWSGAEEDDGSVHCLGNGKLCVFEQGPNVIQLFGPPYSTASVLRLSLDDGARQRSASTREPGTAVWTHRVEGSDTPATFLDYVDSELPCFIREVAAPQGIRLALELDPDVVATPNSGRYPADAVSAALLLTVPAGHYLYPPYPMPHPVYYQVAVTGEGEIVPFEEGSRRWEIRLGPGRSAIYIVGGPLYPDVAEHAEAALTADPATLLARTRTAWKAYTERRRDFAALIPESVPERQEVLEAIDDVAVTIKTQEAAGGGIIAGYPYHLLYVRDQFGVARCLLQLGYLAEARGILEQDWAVWKRHGRIRNAQAVGVDGVFHVHENDDVEITGYLIIQAFDYAAVSGDHAFLEEIRPMLEWAWTRQRDHLVLDMLPFNGDETYVAGGILPRHTLNDGSAEATMLFVESGERLLGWVEARDSWAPDRLEADRRLLERVRDRYRDNFIVEGRYITNNPARRSAAALPRFRHGVCEGCYAFGWTERTATDRYACPVCLVGKELPAAEPVAYALASVALMPLYMGSALLPRADLAAVVDRIVAEYRATGTMPSRPGTDVAVGYDPGLLLSALTELEHPEAESVYRRMMSMRDPVGVWVEYYQDYRPRGTRCRPWESAINLEAALHYLAWKHDLADLQAIVP